MSYLRNKPESIHDTSYGASEPGTAITAGRRPAGRQRAGNRSAASMSAPEAIRGAMDRSRGGAEAPFWASMRPSRTPRQREDINEKVDSYSSNRLPSHRCAGLGDPPFE